MTARKTTIERAFELAREGECSSIDDIRRSLEKERFESVGAHLRGGSITKQLRAAITQGKALKP